MDGSGWMEDFTVQAVKLKNTVESPKMYALHHIYQSHQVGWSGVFIGVVSLSVLFWPQALCLTPLL